MSRTHRVAFTVGELEGEQLRVPVRSSNTLVSLGMFEGVNLETGRGRRAGEGGTCGEIRARLLNSLRVVTLSPRYLPGDVLSVQVSHTRKPRLLLRVTEVKGRRVRDWLSVVVGGDDFNAAAWVARHGRGAWDANAWCWCLNVRKVKV